MAVNVLNVLGAAGKVGAGMQQAEAEARRASEEKMRLAGLRREQRGQSRMDVANQILAEQAATSQQFAPMEAESPFMIQQQRAGVVPPEQKPAAGQPAMAGIAVPGAAPAAPTAATPAAPTAPAEAAPAAPAAPAMPEYGPELQQAMAMRQQQVAQYNELANLARMYQMSGTTQGIEAARNVQSQMNELRNSVTQLDNNMFYLQGRQGLAEFADLGDSTRLSGVLSQYVGAPVEIRDRGDDTYDVYVGGKLRKNNSGLTLDEVSGMARSYFDPEYVSMMGARAQKEFEAQIDLRNLMAIEARKDARALLDRISASDVARIKAENDTKDVKFFADAEGNTFVGAGSSIYRVLPETQETTATGDIITVKSRLEPVGTAQ